MHTYRIEYGEERQAWFCMVTYVWQDPEDPEFREHAFGPFDSEDHADRWGQNYCQEIWPAFEKRMRNA